MEQDEQALRALIARYLDAYNRKDVDAMMALMHPDVEFQDRAGDQVRASTCGAPALRELATRAAAIFDSRRQTLHSLTLSAEGAQLEVSFHGTLALDLPGGPSAGQTISLQGRSTILMRDGLIIRLVDQS